MTRTCAASWASEPPQHSRRHTIRRQLMATTKTVGQVKVDALKERLLTINPSAEKPIDPDGKGNGSIVHITAIFGFMLAGLVVQDAVK